MARGVNRVTLVGYVGAEPEMMHSEQGTPICNISLATTEGWCDMNGQVQTRTEWHRVVFFRRIAEVAVKFLHKGSLVYVEGKLSTSRWTDQEGIVRYTTQIICTELQMLSSNNRQQQEQYQYQAGQGGSYGYTGGAGMGVNGSDDLDSSYMPNGDSALRPARKNGNQTSWNLKKKPYSQPKGGKHGQSPYMQARQSGQYGGTGASDLGNVWKQGRGKGQKPASAVGPVVNEPQLNDDGIDVNAPL